jgi:Predicted permease, DMT superfamily
MTNKKLKGSVMVISAAVLWGASGTVAQYLFQRAQMSAEWLVVVRLMFSGLVLLLFALRQQPRRVFAIWRNRSDAIRLLSFGITGTLAVQYTYFAAIRDSNAATATILQYLGPTIIVLFLALKYRKLPTLYEVSAIICALLGTFLLVTHGNPGNLSISGWALFWGIASAVAMASYTLQPGYLLRRWESTVVIGWGMLIGGLCFNFVHPVWQFTGTWSLPTGLMTAFIVIFGTLLAFYLYLDSLKYISETEVSLIASVEPLSAACIAVIWLGVPFGIYDWIGGLFIVLTIFILSMAKGKK